ncbi:hypothetical protein [Tunturiibacter psychrotolerans]|uniref:hypothetical protein n=1 Tax=Tunturiibacter psychrotolerans TaxID=3069686 RepID=UPI003D19C288
MILALVEPIFFQFNAFQDASANHPDSKEQKKIEKARTKSDKQAAKAKTGKGKKTTDEQDAASALAYKAGIPK